MTDSNILVIVLLLSMIAGFLAMPFTEWLCETVASGFDAMLGLLRRRKEKPEPCNVAAGGAYWTMGGMGVATIIKSLQSKEAKCESTLAVP